MAKKVKVDVVALPIPVYNGLIQFLQSRVYREVAGLLQQIDNTMQQTTIRVEVNDPASGVEESV